MNGPTLDFVWIIRERISVGHIRGLLKQLDAHGGLDASAVRIISLKPGDGYTDGENVYREVDLPAEGLLIQGVLP